MAHRSAVARRPGITARLERAIVAQLRHEESTSQGTTEREAILDSAAIVLSTAIEPRGRDRTAP